MAGVAGFLSTNLAHLLNLDQSKGFHRVPIVGIGSLQSCVERFWGQGRFGEQEPSRHVAGTGIAVVWIV